MNQRRESSVSELSRTTAAASLFVSLCRRTQTFTDRPERSDHRWTAQYSCEHHQTPLTNVEILKVMRRNSTNFVKRRQQIPNHRCLLVLCSRRHVWCVCVRHRQPPSVCFLSGDAGTNQRAREARFCSRDDRFHSPGASSGSREKLLPLRLGPGETSVTLIVSSVCLSSCQLEPTCQSVSDSL